MRTMKRLRYHYGQIELPGHNRFSFLSISLLHHGLKRKPNNLTPEIFIFPVRSTRVCIHRRWNWVISETTLRNDLFYFKTRVEMIIFATLGGCLIRELH